ncbi:hypothetical protein [Streptomyces guryensis]|uniref:Uncharacterized protein n=1 Tax=Streptomyces guryensis TaxID=2886947 RepID=A0A9Q3W0W3_9ACTN|nr:hypothetical protein [Streptomyces guryensis]MCD9880570.1 hypothetical protein [Streptomyces guryensis]
MRPFPDDLARAQQDWRATYRRLAEQPGRTELRRRLHRLSAQLYFHPYWQQRRPSPAAWWELRDLGRPDAPGSERLPR